MSWGIQEEEGKVYSDSCARYIIYTKHPFDDASGGQLPGGQKRYLVMFVGKMHRRASDLYKAGKQ